MKSFQFFINEDLANELITFIGDHELYDCDCGPVPPIVKTFVAVLRDEFQKGQQDDV